MPNDEVNNPRRQVMTFAEAAKAASISVSTLRREISRGTGPRVVSLSTRRRGVKIQDFKRCLDPRTHNY